MEELAKRDVPYVREEKKWEDAVSYFKKKNDPYKLELLQVACGKTAVPVATVGMRINGEIHTATASGNGPIDADFTAVKQLISKTVHLEEFLIQAITRGSDDLGKVHVQVDHQGRIYYGFSANTDIITASVEAFIDAISKIK